MSLTWDRVSGHGLLVGAEDCLVALAIRSPSAAGDGGGGKDDIGGCWSLEAVRTQKIINPGLGIVRQENQLNRNVPIQVVLIFSTGTIYNSFI